MITGLMGIALVLLVVWIGASVAFAACWAFGVIRIADAPNTD